MNVLEEQNNRSLQGNLMFIKTSKTKKCTGGHVLKYFSATLKNSTCTEGCLLFIDLVEQTKMSQKKMVKKITQPYHKGHQLLFAVMVSFSFWFLLHIQCSNFKLARFALISKYILHYFLLLTSHSQ